MRICVFVIATSRLRDPGPRWLRKSRGGRMAPFRGAAHAKRPPVSPPRVLAQRRAALCVPRTLDDVRGGRRPEALRAVRDVAPPRRARLPRRLDLPDRLRGDLPSLRARVPRSRRERLEA